MSNPLACFKCGAPVIEGSDLCRPCLDEEHKAYNYFQAPEEQKVRKVVIEDVPRIQPVEQRVIEITPEGKTIEQQQSSTSSEPPHDQFDFEEGFEWKLLAFLTRDLEFFNRNKVNIRFDHFQNQYCRDICEQVQEYHIKYQEAISKEILRNEIEKMFYERKKRDSTLDEYWERIDNLFAMELTGKQYTEDEVVKFAQCQQMKKVLGDAIDRVTNREDLTPILGDVTKALAIGSKVIEEGTGENLCIEEFPKNAIQGFPKHFAELYSETMESPYPFWVFNVLACMGNILSTRIKLNTSLFVEPRLYIVCLGASGDTRKSESGRQVIRFFDEWAALKEPLREDDQPSQYFNTLTGCGSAEGLMDRLKISPRLILVYDELRSFVQKSNIKGSNLLQEVNTLFENTGAENAVKGHFQQVKDAHLSLLAFCTTDTWDTLFTPSFLDIGFVNRLWIVPGEGKRKDFNPKPIPEHEKKKLMLKMDKLVESFPPNTIIEYTPEAEERLQQWYQSYTRTDFTKRIETYGSRLLLLMAASEGMNSISLGMAERCINLMEWQVRVREAYQPQEYTDTMSQIQVLIRRVVNRNPGITRGRLDNSIHAERFDNWKVDKAIENLVKFKELRQVPYKKTFKYFLIEKPE